MGEVEQIRMATPGGGRVNTLAFRASDDTERALVRDVQTAWRNLTNYLARARSQTNAPTTKQAP